MKSKLALDFENSRHLSLILCLGLLFARFIGLLSSTPEGLRGYGDFYIFFQVSSLPGWPFFDYWVEYPPVFPFLNVVINRLAGGQQHVFDYLLNFVLLLADLGTLYLFSRLANRLLPRSTAMIRAGMYLLVLAVLPYGWWNIDSLVVIWMMLGLTLLLDGKIWRGGLALGLGAATKFFPLLALVAAWRRESWKRLAGMALAAFLPLVMLYGLLWLASPEFTSASLRSQWGKGSWESIWALIDGNIRTGSFGGVAERLDPSQVFNSQGNQARVNPFISLAVFAGVGLAAALRFRPSADSLARDRQSLALVGLAWTLFLLWLPGWSPQWVLYLLPLVLLVLPDQQAVLFGLLLILVNLLEWPVLLSRGLFDFLWVTISLRTLLHVILAGAFYSMMAEELHQRQPTPKNAPTR
jgi:hypothetical protein